MEGFLAGVGFTALLVGSAACIIGIIDHFGSVARSVERIENTVNRIESRLMDEEEDDAD